MVAPIVCTRTGGRMRRRPVSRGATSCINYARCSSMSTRTTSRAGRRGPSSCSCSSRTRPAVALRCALRPVTRTPRRKGGWTKPRTTPLGPVGLGSLPVPSDERALLARLVGATGPYGYGYQQAFTLTRPLADDVLPGLCAAGRIVIESDGDLHRLSWEEGPAWRFPVEIGPAADGRH